MEAVGGSGLTADASVAAIRGAPAAGSLAQQPSEQEAQTANLPLQLDALLSGGAAGKEWAVRLDEAGTPAAPVGSEALAAANPLASSSAIATVMPTSGQAARAAYQRLQTSTLLADCSGAGAEWLLGGAADLQGEQLAAVAEAEAPEAWPAATSFVSQPAADVSPGELDRSEALSRQPSSRDSQKAQPGAKSLQPACLNPPTSSLTDCSTTGSECTANGDAADDGKELLTAAQAVAAGQDGLGRLAEAADERPPSQPGSEPADACAEHIPERPSSAAAEFFQLLPLPPLDNLPAIPLPPYKAQHAEQLLQQQRAPAWQAGSWQDEQPQHSDGSHLSPTADAAASAAATGRDSDRCASNASAALNSPGSGQLFDLKAAGRLGGAAGAAANSSAAGSNGSINQASSQELEVQQPQQLLINATLGPGQAAAQDEDSGSPAAQLARLLGSPLTPDGSPPAAPGGSASGWASSGSGGRPARISPGISPAGSPPPQEAGDDDSGTAAPPAAGGAPVRSLSQQWLAEQLQREVAALQRQAAELREALVAAEGSAAAHAEQAQLLRGQVGSSEERREAAQQAQAQATAALAAALREQAALQRQAEAEAARRAAAEERQRLLEEQLELMLLERSSLGEAVAAGQGDGGLLSTAAELAAGNALMAEVQLLRRQLEETSAAKHRLAESLRDERAHSASLQARLAAATAAAEQAAARHAEAAAAAGASAAASHAAQQQQVEQLAAQVAALELQLERGRAAAAAGATAASLQHQQQAALADQSVAIADLQRQLHAERATLTEQAALADAAAAQVTQQAAAFSEALLHQQQAAAYWQGQARELERQLEAAASSEGEVKSALQETCTKLVAQQQLCHEQQEELQFLRLKYQQLSARLEAAEAGGAGPGAGTKAQQLQQQGRGSQGGSTGRSARLLLQATLERDSPASSASSTPTGSRLRRTGSGSSAGGGGASANGGGSKLGSWLGLRR